jgi:hypothetical protein
LLNSKKNKMLHFLLIGIEEFCYIFINHLTEIWNTIDQNDIRTLISSMGRRCEAVINARG